MANNIITKAGYGKNILHRTGHSIGTSSPHGLENNITIKNSQQLLKKVVYTIEPGIYLKNKFGIRSEIDFFIDENMKLVYTTKIQEKIIKIT